MINPTLLLLITMASVLLATGSARAGDPVPETGGALPDRVILLHGLGRTRRSMAAMATFLEKRGHAVLNLDYPSRHASIQSLSRDTLGPVVARCLRDDAAAPIHFVTHSLGGILVRYYLQDHQLPPGSRVVMLSPPNRGSEIADMLKDFFLYRWLMGPAGAQLGTAPDALPNRVAPVRLPVGIITGDATLEPWFSWRIDGPDDGKVAVARARLPEMADFLVVHNSHAFIMNDDEVMHQSAYFLEHGKFDHKN